jgi:hypothetical protein
MPMVEMACSQYLFERFGCYCLFSSAIRGLKASPHDSVGQLVLCSSTCARPRLVVIVVVEMIITYLSSSHFLRKKASTRLAHDREALRATGGGLN